MGKYLLLMAFLTGLCAFNIDIKDKTVVELNGDLNSHFGYSVGLRDIDNDRKVLVGAPLFKTNNLKAGKLYGCDHTTGNCISIPSSPSNPNDEEQTLGMSITSINDTFLATAPRWKNLNIFYRGKSYVYKDNTANRWYDVRPCENERYYNVYYGYCLSGMSSSGTSFRNSPLFVLGAPGSEQARGSLFTIFKRRDTNFAPDVFRTQGDRLPGQNLLMGYSVSTGRFTKTPNSNYMTDIVGGAPRASDLQGKVIVYTLTTDGKIKITTNIESPHDQIGSYFGAAVCAVDVNNDGKDDLLIASPKYAFNEDEGVVYVYLNRQGDATGFDQSNDRLEGEKHRQAQFGTSITNIGDINKDGYNDVAIGAPYGGPDKKGAVYIYNGGQTGIKSYSQVIYAKDLQNSGGGFGISVAGKVDLDANKYPDLVVGAYKDSKAYILRTRPVITLRSAIRTSSDAIPTAGDSSNFKCNGLFPLGYKCITLFVDLTYFGESTPDNLDFDITVNTDTEKPKKRAFLAEKITTGTQRATLVKEKQSTVNFTVGVFLSAKTDVINPITFIATFKDKVDPTSCTTTPCAIVDQFSSKTASHQITYLKECASKVCKPNLVVAANLTLPKNPKESEVVYGRVYDVEVISKVENLGENAYQSLMKMNFSADLVVNSVEVAKKASTQWEETNLDSSNKQLDIPLGNPIGENKTVDIIIRFSIYKKRPSSTSYTFSMEASSFGEDTNPKNNKASVNVDTKIEYCIVVQSDAKPSLITYGNDLPTPPAPSENNTLNDSVTVDVVGSEVNYTFYVQNSGRLPVENLKASIEVVVQKNNFDFIYVVYLTVGDVVCIDNDFNSLNYKSQYSQRSKRDDGLVSCRSGSCKTYVCEIDKIDKSKGVIISMVTRVWDHNLEKIGANSVELEMKVNLIGPEKDWYIKKPGCDSTSTVNLGFGKPAKEDKKSVEWWIILLAVLGAVLLLAIAIAVLYKLGFFKRKRTAKNITGPNESSNEAENPYDDDDDDE